MAIRLQLPEEDVKCQLSFIFVTRYNAAKVYEMSLSGTWVS